MFAGFDLFQEGFHRIVCTDISTVAIQSMKAKYATLCPTIEWLVSDVINMHEFPSGNFDVVLDKGTSGKQRCAE